MRLTQPLDQKKKKKDTSFHNDAIWFNASDVVECEAHVWTVQRLEISLVAHNAPATKSCMLCLH